MSRDIYEHRHTFEDNFAYTALVMPPLTDEQKEKLYGVRIQRMSLEEAIEQYKDTLTEDQIKTLKNHGKNI